jgi:hypothetical protein
VIAALVWSDELGDAVVFIFVVVVVAFVIAVVAADDELVLELKNPPNRENGAGAAVGVGCTPTDEEDKGEVAEEEDGTVVFTTGGFAVLSAFQKLNAHPELGVTAAFLLSSPLLAITGGGGGNFNPRSCGPFSPT